MPHVNARVAAVAAAKVFIRLTRSRRSRAHVRRNPRADGAQKRDNHRSLARARYSPLPSATTSAGEHLRRSRLLGGGGGALSLVDCTRKMKKQRHAA